ncbi:MAG: M67 family metallopeptidase [Treponema sp.]|jgi:proteasome lid subunit RPN8/RPN11|nr:M67 family metallopeptidase [Treponema sp.]
MIRLSAQWEKAIRLEGEKAYPGECCGVLLGRLEEGGGRLIESIIPIENAREEEERRHRFRIEPEDLMKAERKAAAQNRDVLGFYHSHPDHPARPSEYDREHAFPFYSYIIVSVEKTKAAELTSWRLSDDRREFSEELIDRESCSKTSGVLDDPGIQEEN